MFALAVQRAEWDDSSTVRRFFWLPVLVAVAGLGGRGSGAKFEIELLVTLLT